MAKFKVFKEVLEYALKNKKYWLVPVLIFIAFLAVLIVLSSNAIIAPFIYTVF